MKILVAAIASLSLIASSAQAQETNVMSKSSSMLTRDDVRMVAPALDKYTQDLLFGDYGNALVYRYATAASLRLPL